MKYKFQRERGIFILLLLVFWSSSRAASAQCSAENTAFLPGEELTYDLFFNWKFIWVNAGTATMSINETMWKGKSAYKGYLITRTSDRLDRFFMMRDTLESIITPDMQPLYFKKGANEGGRYYVDEVWYSYLDGKTSLHQYYRNRDGVMTERTYDGTDCIYDMMSMLLRARSFRVADIHKGQKMRFPMADGHKVADITLIYRGRENFRMKSTGQDYRCLVFSFVEYPDGKEKEIITFYISDDDNHIPVRLDLYLRFGTAKAYLKTSKGLRH
ncbi:MAG: DUF3108 domain-containing protein [Prevotellaceae bacterium]|nr:DUF3108 domain-containing protein [Prevotellaceae bacterium]